MLFFKKYRKKIGVCVAMLGVLCCTAFGLCSMKGTSTLSAKADSTDIKTISGTYNFNANLSFFDFIEGDNYNWAVDASYSYLSSGIKMVVPIYSISFKVSQDIYFTSADDYFEVYSDSLGWRQSYYSSISFCGTVEVSSSFYSWLSLNAARVLTDDVVATGGGYTQEDLDQAFQDGVNSVDTNAIRQEGYNAGYQAGLSAGSGTTEEVLQAEYERGYQAGVASIDQSAIRQEGYDEGYSAGLQAGSGVSEETLQAEYERGYQAGYETGYGKGVADSVAEGDYGVFIGSTWTYQAYDTTSHPPYYEQVQVPFEDILKEGSKLFFNSTTLRDELSALLPLSFWDETHVVIDFATPVIKGGLLLGFDTAQLPVHFSIYAGGYAVKLVDNSNNPELSSRYVLDFSNVPDGTFIDSLSFYMHSGQGTKDRDWVFGSTALVTDINLYSLGYNEGYKEGEDSGYDKGYEKGDEVGYNRGYEEGDDVGYNRGYNTGVADAEATSGGFYNLMTSVIDAPVSVFSKLLDFEILGVNIKKFFLGILTTMLLIAVIKFFSGMGLGGKQ